MPLTAQTQIATATGSTAGTGASVVDSPSTKATKAANRAARPVPIATRGWTPNFQPPTVNAFSDAGTTPSGASGEFKVRHKFLANVSEILMFHAYGSYGTGNQSGLTNDLAFIEKPLGNTYTIAGDAVRFTLNGAPIPVRYKGSDTVTVSGGSASGTIVAGAGVWSDPVNIGNVAAGSTFFTDVYVSVPAAGKFPAVQAETANDQTDIGDIGNTAQFNNYVAPTNQTRTTTNMVYSNVRGYAYCTPTVCAVLGDRSKAHVTILGDSRQIQTPDTILGYDDSSAIGRIFEANVWPHWNPSCGGISAKNLLAQWAGSIFQTFALGSDVWIVALTQNDVDYNGAFQTFAQIQASYAGIYNIAKLYGIKVIIPTSPPGSVATTNGYLTVAQQTAGVNSPVRVAVNNALRNGTWLGLCCDDYIELADAVESSRDSGVFMAPPTTYYSGTTGSGWAGSGTSVTVPGTPTWTANQFYKKAVIISAGTGVGTVRYVTANGTSNGVLTLNSSLGFTPDGTTVFNVTDHITKDGTHWGEYATALVAAAFSSALAKVVAA